NSANFANSSAAGVASGKAMPRADCGVEPFPVDVFPPALQDYLQQCAESLGCPVDYVGGAVLAVVGAAIGNTWRLLLRGTEGDGWSEKANGWVVLVGDPGSAKTPAMNAVVSPLQAIDEQQSQAWDQKQAGERRGRPLQATADDCTTEAMVKVL